MLGQIPGAVSLSTYPSAGLSLICFQLCMGNICKHSESPKRHPNKYREVLYISADSQWRHDVQLHCWWKTNKGTRVRKPHITLSLAGPTSPLCCDERRESTSATRLFCLFTFRITPCSSWTMFQCVLLCFLSNRISMRVVSGLVWLRHAHICVHTHPHSTFPLCQRSPLPSPPHL